LIPVQQHSRLSLRVPELSNEPGHGLLARLAARHREPDVHRFARNIGLRFDSVSCGHQIDELARLAGINSDDLIRSSPRIDTSARIVHIGHDRVSLGDWTRKRRRWCPACFADDLHYGSEDGRSIRLVSFHRFWWDIQSVSTCPIHQMPLEANCPRCEASPDWMGIPLHCCACGMSLALNQRRPVRIEANPLDHYLVSRLTGKPREPVPYLDDLAVSDVIYQLERLGLASKGWARFKPPVDEEMARAARSDGFRIARNLGYFFSDSLDSILAQGKTSSEPRGLIASYGWIYEHWIAELPACMLGVVLKRLLREHAIKHGIIAEQEAVLGNAGSPETINITQARRILRMSHERARRMLQDRGLVSQATRQGVAASVDISGVLSIAEFEKAALDATELAKRLGTGKRQLTQILRDGLIAVHDLDYTSKRFPLTEVDSFLANLAQGAPIKRRPQNSDPLPLACQRAGVRLATACRLILDGVVRPAAIAPGPLSLSTIFIKVGDLHPAQNRKAGLSIEDAAEVLSVHHEVARHLVRANLLSMVETGRSKRIDPVSVLRFHSKHVTASEVARKLQTSPRYAAERLSGFGICPVIGPPKCRQVFFARDQISRLLNISQNGAGYDSDWANPARNSTRAVL
jgi:hypothetical protein